MLNSVVSYSRKGYQNGRAASIRTDVDSINVMNKGFICRQETKNV